MELFIDPKILPAGFGGGFQVLFLGAVYGFILFTASNLIAEGSELLLLVPKYSYIVGSVILPILGAVPDGAMVLFSGMGENAQEEVAVGLGTLAGSTVMLLTIPWALSIIMGKVPRGYNGIPDYTADASHLSFMEGEVQNSPSITQSGRFMLITAVSYLIVQIPVYYAHYKGYSAAHTRATEKKYLLIGIAVSITYFCVYIYNSLTASDSGSKCVADRKMQQKALSLLKDNILALDDIVNVWDRTGDVPDMSSSRKQSLLDKENKRLADVLYPIFTEYVDVDKDGRASYDEVLYMLKFFHSFERHGGDINYMKTFNLFDYDRSGYIEFHEFVDIVKTFLNSDDFQSRDIIIHSDDDKAKDSLNTTTNNDAEDHILEHIPSHLCDMPRRTQEKWLTRKAMSLLFVGTCLVLLFSDPMCGVLNEMGSRCSISPFYLSFIFAPLASNAAEAIASTQFAAKKSPQSLEVSLSALTGAANMNNTFCLAIFLIICYVQDLNWNFGPEVLCILVVEFLMYLFAQKGTYTVKDSLVILSLFPISLLFVSLLK